MPCCMAVQLVPLINCSAFRTMLHMLSVRLLYAITVTVTDITLVASTTMTSLQDSTYRVQSHDHVDSSISEWTAGCPVPTFLLLLPLLAIPYIQSDFPKWSFCFISPTVWNALPISVQSSLSRATFKSRLNIAFFEQPNIICTSESMELACYK